MKEELTHEQVDLAQLREEGGLLTKEEGEPELVINPSFDSAGAALLVIGTAAAFSVDLTAGLLMACLTLAAWLSMDVLLKRRIEFWRSELRVKGAFSEASVAYSNLDCSGPEGPFARFGWRRWKMQGRSVLVFLPKWSVDGLPAEDLILQKLVQKGVAVSSPWGAKADEGFSETRSIRWRLGEKVKWIYSLPSLFWFGAVYVGLRSGITPWGDAVIFLVVGSLPLLYLAGSALTRSFRKGVIEFSPLGIKITSRGAVLFECSAGDQKKLQVQVRRRNIWGSQKRLVLITQYSREIPLTEWEQGWGRSGEAIIEEARRSGLPIEILGDPDQPKALDGPIP